MIQIFFLNWQNVLLFEKKSKLASPRVFFDLEKHAENKRGPSYNWIVVPVKYRLNCFLNYQGWWRHYLKFSILFLHGKSQKYHNLITRIRPYFLPCLDDIAKDSSQLNRSHGPLPTSPFCLECFLKLHITYIITEGYFLFIPILFFSEGLFLCLSNW